MGMWLAKTQPKLIIWSDDILVYRSHLLESITILHRGIMLHAHNSNLLKLPLASFHYTSGTLSPACFMFYICTNSGL